MNSLGTAPDTPVVLLPGAGATSASFVDVLRRLASRRHVHAVDILGDTGRSIPGPGRPRTITELLGWLEEVLDALGVDEVDLVGHSYGAMIALAYATGGHRDRVRHLTLLEPTSCFAGFRAGHMLRALPTLVALEP